MNYIILIILIIIINYVHSQNRVEEIVNAEHLEDITHFQDGSGLGRIPAAVAFYDETICRRQMNDFRALANSVPDRRLFLLGEYEVVRNPALTWYKFTDDYDLVKRYNVTVDENSCPTILFFPMFENSKEPIRYDSKKHGTIRDFIWSNFRLNRVPFQNLLSEPVELYFQSSADKSSKVNRIEPNDVIYINTYISHIFTAHTLSGRFIDGFEISHHTSYIINENEESQSLKDWYHQYEEKKKSNLKFWISVMWSHTRRHLYNMKIPRLLPKFTSNGYKKTKLPDEALKILTEFYKNNKHKATVEDWPRGGTQVNFDTVRTKMVYLTNEIKLKIAELIRPILEKWCGCDLKYNTMYGLREYFHGSILRNHVDRIGTHVISAIINVYEDLDEDWELELINFDGDKVRVKQHPGDLIMYESSTLIHGRPTPLKGRVYASGFIHFHPTDNWYGKYETTPDNVIVTPTQKVPLYPINLLGNKFQGTNPYHTRDLRASCEWPFQNC